MRNFELRERDEQVQLQRIIEAHYEDVYAYCRRRAASAEDAQDLTQEVFLRAFRSFSRHADAGKPLAYLLTIARNICIDASRKHRIEQVVYDERIHDCAEDDADDDSDSPVKKALSMLSGDDREVLELRFDQGLSVNEVASVLGISRFSASRRIKRALRQLERSLKAEGKGEGEGGDESEGKSECESAGRRQKAEVAMDRDEREGRGKRRGKGGDE